MKKMLAIGLCVFLTLGSTQGWSRTRLPKSGGRVSVDFQDVEIKDVVNAISEITGLNFILGEGVRGKVTIISPSSVTVEEAYEAFLTVLNSRGLEAVDKGSFYLIQRKDSKEPGTPVTGSTEGLFKGEKITKTIKLKYLEVEEVREALRRKLPRSDDIIAYGPTNSLIVTATVKEIEDIEKLIRSIDREGFKSTTEVIKLKHAQAEDVANKLKTILQSTKGEKQTSKRNNIAGGEDISSIIPDGRTNSLLVTATRKGLEEILDLLEEIDRPITKDQNKIGKVHIKKLNHADAEDMADLLSRLFSGSGSSPRRSSSSSTASDSSSSSSGEASSRSRESAPIAVASGGIFEGEVRVAADAITNSILVTANYNDFQALLPVVEQLDQRRSQVFVEALIMEVKMEDNLGIGFSFNGAAGNKGGGVFGKISNGSTPSLATLDKDSLGKLASAAGLVVGGLAGSTFTLPGTGIQLPVSGATFNAMQKNDVVNVLSAPNILTTDNVKAEISVGSKVPVSTGKFSSTDGGSQFNVTREEVALKLSVTPQINDGDSVTLEIEQQIQELGAPDNVLQSYSTSERSAKTTVVAQNQQTISLGGLIKDKETKTRNKVPLLGSIPLLGHLFKETSTSKEKVNLILFLTPHIIRDPSDLSRISVKKNDERKAFNRKHKIKENQALYDYDLNRGLDMAPRSSRKIEKPKTKRFEYEKFDMEQDAREATELEKEDLANKRMGRNASQRREAARKVTRERRRSARSDSTIDESNPFADVKPIRTN